MVRDADAKHRRLTAILFTDIVDFSALVNRDAWTSSGASSAGWSRPPAGREIETAGDSFLLEFASAFAALRCVVAIQQAPRAEPLPASGDPPVRLRASIHLGDIEHRGREVFGDGVNIAARLLPMVPEGGLTISDQVHAQIRHRLDVGARSLGLCELKNIRYPVEVLVFDAQAIAAIPVDVPGASPAIPARRAQRLRAGSILLLLTVALGLGGFAIRGRTLPASGPVALEHRRIAVLPFASFSSGRDDDMLAPACRTAS